MSREWALGTWNEGGQRAGEPLVPLQPPGGGGGPLSSQQAPPHYSHQGGTQVEGHRPQQENLPEADWDSQAGGLQTCTAKDPRLGRVKGQVVQRSRSESRMPGQNHQQASPHTHRQGRGVQPVRRVPASLPQPHLRPEGRAPAEAEGQERWAWLWDSPSLSEASPAWGRCPPAGRVVGAGPLDKWPTASPSSQLLLGDFRKKRGSGDSHLAPQEPGVAHRGVLKLPEARPVPHAA